MMRLNRSPPVGQSLANLVQGFRPPAKRTTGRLGDGSPRTIVNRGSQPSGHDDKINPLRGSPDRLDNILLNIPYDRLEPNLNPNRRQRVGDKQRIPFPPPPQQHLRPNCNHFCINHDHGRMHECVSPQEIDHSVGSVRGVHVQKWFMEWRNKRVAMTDRSAMFATRTPGSSSAVVDQNQADNRSRDILA